MCSEIEISNNINTRSMLSIFKKKSEKEILQKKYRKLMEEAHRLSHINRTQSDLKVFEAEEVLKRLDQLS